MSFQRTFIAAVAALGLATSVFAADETTTTTQTTDDTIAQAQPADTTTTATTTATTDETTITTEQTKIDLNKATAKELAKVKGLSAAKAKAIVSYRKKHGEFKSIDDLKEVKGFKKIDEKTLKDIQEQLAIN